jgi:hypothetical protein
MRKKNNKSVNPHASSPHAMAFVIAMSILTIIISTSFKTGRDYMLLALLLMCPIIIYELLVRMMEFYWSNFSKYQETLGGIPLFFTRILYTFTFITIVCILCFFTYETFENSYLKSKDAYDFRHTAVVELQRKMLQRFCCPGKTISEQEIMGYLRSQLESSFMHHHVRDYRHDDADHAFHRNEFVEGAIDQVMDVIEHNTGFRYDNDTRQWTYGHDFAPVNVLRVCFFLLLHTSNTHIVSLQERSAWYA